MKLIKIWVCIWIFQTSLVLVIPSSTPFSLLTVHPIPSLFISSSQRNVSVQWVAVNSETHADQSAANKWHDSTTKGTSLLCHS